MEPHLGDDDSVIRPTIGIADCLGHRHLLSISPLGENIVRQLPAPRSRVHPPGHLPRRKAVEGVVQQKTVFRTVLQKKEAVIVAATKTVGTRYSLPGSVLCPDAKANHLIRFRHSRQQGVSLLVEFVLRRIGEEQTSNDVVPDGKGDTSVTLICLWSAAPEEGVAGTHLQLTLLRESGMNNRQVMQEVERGYRMPNPHTPQHPCPNALYEIMLSCWNVVPEKRPTFMHLFATFDSWEVQIEGQYIDNAI
ncbi:unnamed protein product [Schistocephalus solidus]|uniref:Pkinase_Tyr domain-containing protein n=1 Tax=Schistocephalus solidus TaxID=70667 RepID=A0A183TR54_SCHSO|nr:unnamed protein product [Schistocephalus solidus]